MIKYVYLLLIILSTTNNQAQELNPPLLISGKVTNSTGIDIALDDIHFKIFLKGQAEYYLTENSSSCGFQSPIWFAELGNLAVEWNFGDDLVIIIENIAHGERVQYTWKIDSTAIVPDIQTQPIPINKQITQFELSDRGVFEGIPVEFNFHSAISQLNHVELKIFDSTGGVVFSSSSASQTGQNQYQFTWDGKTSSSNYLRSGVYLYFLINRGETIHSGIVSLKND